MIMSFHLSISIPLQVNVWLNASPRNQKPWLTRNVREMLSLTSVDCWSSTDSTPWSMIFCFHKRSHISSDRVPQMIIPAWIDQRPVSESLWKKRGRDLRGENGATRETRVRVWEDDAPTVRVTNHTQRAASGEQVSRLSCVHWQKKGKRNHEAIERTSNRSIHHTTENSLHQLSKLTATRYTKRLIHFHSILHCIPNSLSLNHSIVRLEEMAQLSIEKQRQVFHRFILRSVLDIQTFAKC